MGTIGFKKRLIQRGVPEDKIALIYNWSYPISDAIPDKLLRQQMNGKFMVLFAGNFGAAQGLTTVLNAAKLLKDKFPNVCFALAGSGVEEDRLRQQVLREKIDNVVFLGRRPPEAMGPLYSQADALLVHLKDDPLFTITIPSKIQTYLIAGKPILVGVRGDASELVKEAGAGVIFTPEDANSLVESVQKLLSMNKDERIKMGQSGRKFYQEHLSLEAGAKAFDLLFKEAAINKI